MFIWEILRPDAIEVLDNKKARKSLKNYFGILFNKRKRKAELCKSVEIEFRENSPLEELWEIHDNAMREFRKLEIEAEKSISENYVSEIKIERKEKNLLDLKIAIADKIFEHCIFCERRCRVNRKRGKTGFCGVLEARIASKFMHHGEEPELVPSYTIFFSGCNFMCRFCQNYDISQSITGVYYPPEAIGREIDSVKARNVNFVGGEPTPNLNYILKVLKHSNKLASVWNSNMYLTEEALKLLEGTQDVYLTDFKYGNNECAFKYSGVKNYFDVVSRNHKLAAKQGEVIVRHLVLPNHVECCTENVVKFVAEELGRETRFNLMFQYRPLYKARECGEINRRLTEGEMEKAIEIVKKYNLENWIT